MERAEPSLYLVRHAKAGDRARWEGPDERRPLSKAGLRQAKGLVDELAESAIRRLLTSPSLRCVQTLEPLAAARGLPIERSRALGEGGSPDLVLPFLSGLAREGGVACCTHGDILDLVLEWLRERGVALDGPLSSRKGSTWVLEQEGGEIVSGRYLKPPGA
ncbi:MAG: SixA phosphatase family protein [Gaiellaceae bacterium]